MDLNTFDFSQNIPNLNIPNRDYIFENVIDNITPIDEIIDNKLKPILESNQKVIDNLSKSYIKLEKLYEIKEKELEEANKDAIKAKRYNVIMMVVSIISMLVAVAAWLLPNILGGKS